MRFMQRNFGMTILLSTSDSEECLRGDFISYLRNGRVIETCRPTELLSKWSVDSIEKALYCIAVQSGDYPENRRDSCDYEHLNDRNFRENTWMQRNRMYKDFRRNFPSPTNFFTSQGVLVRERFLSFWRKKVTYLFVGVIIPSIVLLAFYYSIGQEVNHNAKVGMCEFIYFLKFRNSEKRLSNSKKH